jgi:polysaccharide chain length determinant protein (PEP-CTERM system associated)
MSRLEAGRAAVAKLGLDLSDAVSKRDALQRELETVPKSRSVDAARPQVVVAGKTTGPQARLEAAQVKLDELRTRFTEQHPDIIALRKQVAELQNQARKEPAEDGGRGKAEIANPLYDQIKVRLVEAETEVASAERRLKQAKDEQAALEEKARATPGVQAQAQDLNRDYAIKKKNFEELLQRREQTTIAEAADTTAEKIQFRIIDPPQVPIIPAAPNQPVLLSGVFALAVSSAISLPLLFLQFDKSFATVTALRSIGVPVLGSVSWLPSPSGRRRNRIQSAALCASASVLVMVYGVLLAFSVQLYRAGWM